jgi:hypothetical protein
VTPHLRGNVRAYVDRALPAPILHAFDKHLVCCAVCRALADQERRIVATLRSETGVPQSLRSSLIGLAGPSGSFTVPAVPRPPLGLRMPQASLPGPVPTVPPTSPALHHSPVRAAVLASLAAGASVAAAWGLAVSPIPAGSPLRPAVARVPAGAATLGPASLAPAFVGPARSRTSTPWAVQSRPTAEVPASRSTHGATTPVRISLVNSAESRP